MSRRGSTPAAPVLGSSAALCAQATTISPAIAAAIHRDTLPKDLMVVPPSRVPDAAVPWWPGAPLHSISRVDTARLKVLAREQSDAPYTRRVLFESLGISAVDFRCQAHVAAEGGEEPYRYAHPLPGGDACTILTVETHRALELVASHAPADAEHPERPFRRGHGLSSPRAVWLHWEFLNLVARKAGRLALEDSLAELANEAVGCAYGAPLPSR